jgi:hypothetical protein
MRCNREPQQGGLSYETSLAAELGLSWIGISLIHDAFYRNASSYVLTGKPHQPTERRYGRVLNKWAGSPPSPVCCGLPKFSTGSPYGVCPGRSVIWMTRRRSQPGRSA